MDKLKPDREAILFTNTKTKKRVLGRVYWLLDLTTMDLELYNTLALARSAVISKHSGVLRRYNHTWLKHCINRDKQVVLLEGRLLIGVTRHIYVKKSKIDLLY